MIILDGERRLNYTVASLCVNETLNVRIESDQISHWPVRSLIHLTDTVHVFCCEHAKHAVRS